MVTKIWVNIGAGNGLVLFGNITWIYVAFLFVSCYGIHLRAILQQVLKLLFCKMSSKIISDRITATSPGTNGLSSYL